MTFNPVGRIRDAWQSVNGAAWYHLGPLSSGDGLFWDVKYTVPQGLSRYTYSLVWHHIDADWNDGLDCEMRRDVSIRSGRGRDLPLRWTVPWRGPIVAGAPLDCTAVAKTPFTVIARSGSIIRKLIVSDQCYPQAETHGLPMRDGWTLSTNADGPKLVFYGAGLGSTRPTRTFLLTVHKGSSTSSRKATADFFSKPEVIFRKGTDAFFNYCVQKHAATIRSDHGRLYCVASPPERGWTWG